MFDQRLRTGVVRRVVAHFLIGLFLFVCLFVCLFQAFKVFGIGPRVVTGKMVESLYKYVFVIP